MYLLALVENRLLPAQGAVVNGLLDVVARLLAGRLDLVREGRITLGQLDEGLPGAGLRVRADRASSITVVFAATLR